jgi:hypothetical protein
VNMALNLLVSLKADNFFTTSVVTRFSKGALLHEVIYRGTFY